MRIFACLWEILLRPDQARARTRAQWWSARAHMKNPHVSWMEFGTHLVFGGDGRRRRCVQVPQVSRLVRERELSVPRTSARVPLQSRRRRCLPLLAPSLLSLPPSLSHLSASLRLIHPPCCVAASGDESRLADLQVDPTQTRASSRVTCCGRAPTCTNSSAARIIACMYMQGRAQLY